MRILSAAVVAALFTVSSLAAYAQTAAPAPAKAAAKVKCRKLAEADCKAPDCTWTPGADASKPGKCSKATKAK